MRDGKLLQLDTPDEIYNRPADLFVAGFTGAGNLIDGKVVARNGEFGTIAVGAGETLLARLGVGVGEGSPVRVALRPDNVALQPVVSGPNRFTGRVTSRHYQGTQTVYQVSTLGTTIEALEVGSSARYAVESEITIGLPPEICWAYVAEG